MRKRFTEHMQNAKTQDVFAQADQGLCCPQIESFYNINFSIDSTFSDEILRMSRVM